MKAIQAIFLFLFISLTAKSQHHKDTTIYFSCGPIPKGERVGQENNGLNADECPIFRKGDKVLDRYLDRNVKRQMRRENAMSVFVELIIEKDGSTNPIHILRGQTPKMNAEAIRIIKSLPKWIPAKVKNHPVRIRYILPVRFGRTIN